MVRNVEKLVAPALLALLFCASTASALILPTSGERKCLGKLGKLSTKLASTVAKETAKCRESDIKGVVVGGCPSAANLTKIANVADKVVSVAEKLCKSVCSVSTTVECVSDGLCPPLANGVNENCSAGAKNQPFEMRSIGYPGPYCEAAIGGSIVKAADIGECSSILAQQVGADLIDSIYGGLTNASGVSADAIKCLSSVSKASRKLAATMAKSVIKCRDGINKGKLTGDPKACATADDKAAAKIAKAEDKLRDTIAGKCTVSDVSELDICGAGAGGITTIGDAQDCLVAAAREVGDSSEVPATRLFAPISIVESAFPPLAVCGDNIVNQLPNKNLLLGEECDGSDDSACPGACLPPGDLFECTCGDKPRMRAFADGPATDSDAGWTGNSFDQQVADRSGFIIDLSNCDCDQFAGADCTGTSSDPLCDVSGTQTPFCSWDTTHSLRCDTVGNGDGKDRDEDCKICDSFSANAGAICTNSTECQSRCYDSGGVDTGPCGSQADCAAGEVCRGRCDDTQTCIVTPNGAPLPVAAAGAAVCNVQLFREKLSGTRNIVTGENAMYFKLFSITHLGERVTRPCPVCGGFCVGGVKDLEVCAGRCEVSGDPCRFDTDCPGAGEICSDQSPDCPDGFCQLQLICGTNPGGNATVEGAPCRIDYDHTYFGSISNDCLPSPGLNVNGEGFRIDHNPTGSELKTLAFSVPCTAAGFELFDCPCPSDGGHPTQPNACTPACDAGAELGTGCADGNSAGDGTRCAAGVNAGKLCDENSDCPGSSCSSNPKHCTGDPAFERFVCATNADCGLGVCGDACPSGRCVPLCLPELVDPEDGVCAAGPPIYSCNSEKYGFLCTKASSEAGCLATCSGSAAPCDSIDDCPSGETCNGLCEKARACEAGLDAVLGTNDDFPGAGNCVAKPRSCTLDPIMVEGGDLLNGKGSTTNYLRSSIWCFGKTINAGVNSTSGFGGPGVIRERGVNVLNVDSIP